MGRRSRVGNAQGECVFPVVRLLPIGNMLSVLPCNSFYVVNQHLVLNVPYT